MQPQQLEHYIRLPDHSAKARYLVQIGEARDYSEACAQMNRRRRNFSKDRKDREDEKAVEQRERVERERAIRANPYADLDY